MAGAVDTVLLLQVVMNPQLSVEPAHRGRDGGEAEGSQPPPTQFKGSSIPKVCLAASFLELMTNSIKKKKCL